MCGLPRFSLRSLVAVCTFMATGAITATASAFIANAISPASSTGKSPQLGTPWLASVFAVSAAVALSLLIYSLLRSRGPSSSPAVASAAVAPNATATGSSSSSSGGGSYGDSGKGAGTAVVDPEDLTLTSGDVAAVPAAATVGSQGPVLACAPRATVEPPLVMVAAGAAAALFGVGLAFSGM